MENSNKLVCKFNEEVVRVCTTRGCKQHPLICAVPTCQCQKLHIKCMSSSFLNNIKHNLQIKGKSLTPIYQMLREWYQTNIKLFTIRLEQINKNLQENKLALQGDQIKLYDALKQNKSDVITSRLVSNVVSRLQKAPTIDIQDRIYYLKNQLQRKSSQLKYLLYKVKGWQNNVRYIKNKIKQKNFFSKYMKNQNIEIVNNSVIKFKKSILRYHAILLQYSVSQFQNKKQIYKFKNLKSDNNIFGFCYLNPMMSQNYIDNDISEKKSFYLLGNRVNKWGQYQQLQGENSISQISQNDEIWMSFDPMENKIVFQNVTKNKKNQFNIQRNTQQPFRACVMLQQQGNSVQFLGMEIIKQ